MHSKNARTDCTVLEIEYWLIVTRRLPLYKTKPKSIIMKKKLTVCLALLILCAFCMNTAFAQDVRQKPVIKKQATTTTTKQTPTKQQTTTAKKQTSTKKQTTAAITETKQTGRVVSSCKWDAAEEFHEGLARVKNANGKWGFIDKTGLVVLPCQWNGAFPFHKGRAEVKDTNGNWVKIDKTGKVVR